MKERNLSLGEKLLFALLFFILPFFAGFILSNNYLTTPMNEAQFKTCEQVVKNIYIQRHNFLLEVPENINIDKTPTEIRVNQKGYTGAVIGKQQNGKLVITRDLENSQIVITNIVVGIFFIAGTFITFLIVGNLFFKNNSVD